MKKAILILLLSFHVISSFSQEISLKYGKVTEDELKMSSYDKDTTASAVVLYEDGYTSYNYNDKVGFQIIFDLRKKIKILKQDGTSEADISIPYYYKGASDRETISGLEAYAYNLENGKIVKSKLEKKYIFDEEINNRYRQIKFSIPNVKAGTVIEYKYKNTSPHPYDLPDWNIQADIPVLNSYYEVLIPEYYIFNIDAAKGFEKISVQETSQNQPFHLGYYNGQQQTVNSNSRLLKISGKDIPALKSEPFVWCVNDFVSGVRFEIQGTKFPNDFYKPYTNTWENLEDNLRDKTDFGSNMKMSNPYKQEVKAIAETYTTDEEKITAVYSLIKEKIRWNDYYSFWGNNAKDAVKNGTGDNGQINMVLLSALKDAGIKAYPVLLNRRTAGRIPYMHPSLNKLNTFVIAAENKEGERFYMDGSAVHGGLNVLPINLLVDRARIFNQFPGEKWVNLTRIAKNRQVAILKATLNEDGLLTCGKTTKYMNQIAYNFKSSYASKKDSAEYIDNFQELNNIIVEKFNLKGIEPMSNAVEEELIFTKNYDKAGDFIYINPMIFTHMETNPFTQSERKLPIEFNYPYSYNLNTILEIPDSYEVDEIPRAMSMSLENNNGKCIYNIQQNGNTIQLSYRFELNQVIFPQHEYEMIREFFGQTATKNTEMIVLKKK